MGSEARKVGMHLVISSISATVDDLASSAAVRDNLAQLTLTRAGRAKNQGELKWARKDVEIVELPGPYRPALPWPAAPVAASPVELDLIGYDAGPVAPSPDPLELEIFRLHQAGLSYRRISQEAFGSTGGNQIADIKRILAKFGVSE